MRRKNRVRTAALLAVLLVLAVLSCLMLPTVLADGQDVLADQVVLGSPMAPTDLGSAAASGEIQPQLNQGRKWRIGFCEAAPWINYAEMFTGLIQGLAEYGWLQLPGELPAVNSEGDTSAVWAWLAVAGAGNYLEFPADAHYTLSHLTAPAGGQPVDVVIDRIRQQQDLDIMIVMGTQAGLLLSAADLAIPVFAFSTSNAYQSGIVSGIDYSGKANVWAHMDILRFQRQVQVFHDLFQFQRLGFVYEDTDVGRAYAAFSDIEAVAVQRDFSLVTRTVGEPADDSAAEIQRYRQELQKAYADLADEVDAFYITVGEIDPAWLPELLAPFYDRKIPVFSQLGNSEVETGALLSITSSDFTNVGRFGADTIIRALSGVPLTELTQNYASTPQIIINLTTAQTIGYRPAFDILLVADRIYH